MDIEKLKKEILTLLETSHLPEDRKVMTKVLLPVMSEDQVMEIHGALVREKERLEKLDQRRERVELKYKIMSEKLTSFDKEESKTK